MRIARRLGTHPWMTCDVRQGEAAYHVAEMASPSTVGLAVAMQGEALLVAVAPTATKPATVAAQLPDGSAEAPTKAEAYQWPSTSVPTMWLQPLRPLHDHPMAMVAGPRMQQMRPVAA